MKTFKLLITLVFFLFLSCTSQQKIMDSWKGHTKQELVLAWGPPTKIVSDQNSGEIFLYSSQHYYQGLYVPGQNEPVGAYTYWKYTMFYVNSLGKIYYLLITTQRVPPTEFRIDLYVH